LKITTKNRSKKKNGISEYLKRRNKKKIRCKAAKAKSAGKSGSIETKKKKKKKRREDERRKQKKI